MGMSRVLWQDKVLSEVQRVMEAGKKKGKSGWEKRTARDLACRANIHIERYWFGLSDKDDLVHALAFLMMAVAVDRGHTDSTEDK